jgi:hypothetical protein
MLYDAPQPLPARAATDPDMQVSQNADGSHQALTAATARLFWRLSTSALHESNPSADLQRLCAAGPPGALGRDHRRLHCAAAGQRRRGSAGDDAVRPPQGGRRVAGGHAKQRQRRQRDCGHYSGQLHAGLRLLGHKHPRGRFGTHDMRRLARSRMQQRGGIADPRPGCSMPRTVLVAGAAAQSRILGGGRDARLAPLAVPAASASCACTGVDA